MSASVSSPAAPSAKPSAKSPSGPVGWLYDNPYLLLILTMAMWGGHSVVSRLAVGEISPATLTCLRWLIVCSFMLTLSWRAGLRLPLLHRLPHRERAWQGRRLQREHPAAGEHHAGAEPQIGRAHV